MTEDLLRLRERPDDRPVMRQKWHHLTFVHWAVDPDVVRSRLPQSLEPDIFEGRAYLSLVPFTMTGVTPVRLRPRPFFSDFHETNVRTYVKRKGRDPGVWFFSLEASKLLPVVVARNRYRLPYHLARMSIRPTDGACSYRTERLWPGPASGLSELGCAYEDEPCEAVPGTLEFWLLERYLLYARSGGRLFTGRVHHPPYRFTKARLTSLKESLTTAAGFPALGPPLANVQFSPHVAVDVFALRPCD